MKKKGKLHVAAVVFLLIISSFVYHLQARTSSKNLRPKSVTPSVYEITPFPAHGSFVDGTDVVLYGVEISGYSAVPIIMKMGPDGTLRWSKEITSLSAGSGPLNVRATKFGAD
ncbi:MAG: hypothetical protein NZ851_00975 [Aquificaceae bacterium]|nr:hypothetical protein [Aquificaceae bacterium]